MLLLFDKGKVPETASLASSRVVYSLSMALTRSWSEHQCMTRCDLVQSNLRRHSACGLRFNAGKCFGDPTEIALSSTYKVGFLLLFI